MPYFEFSYIYILFVFLRTISRGILKAKEEEKIILWLIPTYLQDIASEVTEESP